MTDLFKDLTVGTRVYYVGGDNDPAGWGKIIAYQSEHRGLEVASYSILLEDGRIKDGVLSNMFENTRQTFMTENEYQINAAVVMRTNK